MKYIETFTFPSESEEDSFVLSYPHLLEMQCYDHNNIYPFRLFDGRGLRTLEFSNVTMLYGGNGSGKSTVLNLIAQKLSLMRSSPFNRTPFIDEYLKLCKYELSFGKSAPPQSRIITSDDVFDFLLDIRAINDGIEHRRAELFAEYDAAKGTPYRMRSLDDYDELKKRNEAKRSTRSAYVTRRSTKEIRTRSNGESAYAYFTHEIGDNALYLLDEPENSLSPMLQKKLFQFIEDSARFYNCQFIISTHSPFLLSMKGARIYDLDSSPVCQRRWTELESVRIYHELFRLHRDEFK